MRAAEQQMRVVDLKLQVELAEEQEAGDGLLLSWELPKGNLLVEADGSAQRSWLEQQATQRYNTTVEVWETGMPDDGLPFMAFLPHMLMCQRGRKQRLRAVVQGSLKGALEAVLVPLLVAVAHEVNDKCPMSAEKWEEAFGGAQELLDACQLARDVVSHVEEEGYARLV